MVAAWSAPAAWGRDVTFLFTADTHYGANAYADDEAANKLTIDNMNALPGTAYPGSIGGIVGTPRGLLIAGDLTDAGHYIDFYGLHVPPLPDIDGWDDDFGINGEARIRYPVFEGYGNHDVADPDLWVLQGIRARNLLRSQPLHLSDDGLHYSWDWDDVHFVNLNIYPGADTLAANSLSFLIDDLATRVGDSGRPVILYHHYGFDSFSKQPRWWTEAERDAYAAAIADYNVAGIFHGHLHTTLSYQWEGYNVFDGSAAKDGNFLVVHLTDTSMTVAAREGAAWGLTFSKTITAPVPEMGTLWLCAIPVALICARARGGS